MLWAVTCRQQEQQHFLKSENANSIFQWLMWYVTELCRRTRKLLELFVCSFTISFDSMLQQCVYFTSFSFLLNLFFFSFFLASSVFRFSSIQIHFSAFVSRCLGDVHETHKHTYIFSCICSFRRTWHINGCIAGCHVFLSYVQCFQYAPNRFHWNQYRAEGLTTLHTMCCFCCCRFF